MLSIDFDGVIHDRPFGRRDLEEKIGWGKPIPGAFEAICRLQDAGYVVVVYTCLVGQELQIREWFSENMPRYMSMPEVVTDRKPYAIAYIDDRGIRFENNWPSIVKYFV